LGDDPKVDLFNLDLSDSGLRALQLRISKLTALTKLALFGHKLNVVARVDWYLTPGRALRAHAKINAEMSGQIP
jgi:hypothetical protein